MARHRLGNKGADVRALTPTLTEAQQRADRLPYVEAKVYDYAQGIGRIHWTRIYDGSEPDYYHDIAFDGQGSMHRVRAIGVANTLWHQKIVSPDDESDYSLWTQIADDCAGPCAIAASGSKVYIFYQKTDEETFRKRYSADYGASWLEGDLAVDPYVQAISATWREGTDEVVCMMFREAHISMARIIAEVLDSTTQAVTQFYHTIVPYSIGDRSGIGSTWQPSDGSLAIVVACKTSPMGDYSLILNTFSSANVFGTDRVFIQAPEGSEVSYHYPDCHIPTSPLEHETIQMAAAEICFTGPSPYTRTIGSHLTRGTTWAEGLLLDPWPFINMDTGYGFRISSDATHWWMERPDAIWWAPRDPPAPLDLSGDILALRSKVNADSSGHLDIVLDNSDGSYAAPGTGALAPLDMRSQVELKLGYKTTEGDESVDAGAYWIDEWEWSSTPGFSTFTLHCIDLWSLADRWAARYDLGWNRNAAETTLVEILAEIFARFGIRLWNNTDVSRSTEITTLQPDFFIGAGQHGAPALRKLLYMVPDGLVPYGQETYAKELLSDEASCYAYGTDHVIREGAYSQRAHVTLVQAEGRDELENRLIKHAFDWEGLARNITDLDVRYDPNLSTVDIAQDQADAILRRHQQKARTGRIKVPVNCGQQLYDVIAVTDGRVSIDVVKHRIVGIETDYDRRSGRYDSVFVLGAV
jgi:hypothetical protein